MKRRILMMGLTMALLLSGCTSWMDGSYVSIKPHVAPTSAEEDEIITVGNLQDLCAAIEVLVNDGIESGIIYITPDYTQEDLVQDLETIKKHIIQDTPIGAYAVSDFLFQIGSKGGADALSVLISYRHNRAAIQSIAQVAEMDDVCESIFHALDSCDANTVVMVSEYREIDFSQVIEDYAREYPDIVMETPMISVATYPNQGDVRILEISYSYQTSRDILRSFRAGVEPVFSSAALYVSQDADDHEKFSQLYSFLTERYTYRFETSITPSYSLLRHGVGDSRAFATIYASMCRRAGLTCYYVSGTRDGEPHYWNIICDSGYFYHVDLLRCIEEDAFSEKTDAEMEAYVWNYSAFPKCEGVPPAPEGISG